MDHDSALLVNDVRTDLAKDEDENIQNNICSKDNDNQNVVINRAWYTKSSFDVVGDYNRRKIGYKDRLKTCCSSCCPKSLDVWKLRILSLFPFLNILKSYSKNDFLCDIIAGLTVGVMHIPQGMAYGILANIDPVFGLYTSFFSIFIYFIFGTSRHISIGVFAVVSLMIGSVVDKADCSFDSTNSSHLPFESSLNYSLSTESTFVDDFIANEIEKCKVQHALTVTFIVGIIQLLMGIFHFGFVTVYLSDPLTRGLITGAGVHVFSSQIKHVFGISLGRFNGPLKLVFLYKNCFEEIKNTNPAPLVVCLVCVVIIYCLQRWVSPKMKKYLRIPIPAELLLLIIGTLLSHFLKFSSPSVFNMKVVGKIPTGLPIPQPPAMFLIPKVFIDAVAISVVTFTINISMAKMFSVKHGYKLDSNQELVAYGMTNMIGSCFNSYVSTASLSRTLVQESTGGKTQVASLVASMLLLVVLLFVGPLFRDLPNCVLAAVIIVNLRGIFMQVLDIRYLKRISTSDMLTWVVTCIAVILTDVDFGLVIGLSFSFLTVVIRNQTPKVHELGNIPGTELYEDVEDYKKAIEIDRIKIFSLDTSLFYANAEHFQTTILENIFAIINNDEVKLREIKVVPREEENDVMVDKNAQEESDEIQSFDVIIDCSRMSFVDDVGIKALNIIAVELVKRNMKMSLTHCSSGLNHTLRKAMELKKLEKCQIFCTNHDAVKCLSDDIREKSRQPPAR